MRFLNRTGQRQSAAPDPGPALAETPTAPPNGARTPAQVAAAAPAPPAVPTATPLGANDAQRLINAATAQVHGWPAENELRKHPAVAALLSAPDPVRVQVIRLLVQASVGRRVGANGRFDEASIARSRLLPLVARKRVAMEIGLLLELFELLTPTSSNLWPFQSGLGDISGQIEFNAARLEPTDRARFDEAARGLLAAYPKDGVDSEQLRRLRKLVSSESGGVDIDQVSERDAIGRMIRDVVRSLDLSDARDVEFVRFLISPSKVSGKPSNPWAKAMPPLAAAAPSAGRVVAALLQGAVDAADTDVEYGAGRTYRQFVVGGNEGILLNAVWTAAILKDETYIPLLRDLAAKCTQVVVAYGSPRSLTTSNACAHAIADIGGGPALTALRTLERTIKHGAFVKEVGKAIESMASAEGKSRSELLETAVEDYGLDVTGRKLISFGAHTAEVAIVDNDVRVTWRDGSGKELKSAPAAAKAEHATDYKALQATVKSIAQSMAAERQRLDALLVENREWDLTEWQSRYLRHPVTGALARSLIWHFRSGGSDSVGLPRIDGSVHTAGGEDVDPPADARVKLWHPLDGTPEDVRHWRQRIFQDRVHQPFKQAFRETYTVTPAELETRTYSNRFGAHVIRQVQARSLMKTRGWSAVILAWWDDGIDHGVAKKTYQAHGIRAEFFYDPITDFQPTGSDSWPYITTDQVAFFGEGDRRLDTVDVPSLVFSEAMRDVDLFVGVTSIGADPNWLDHGERQFDTYWQRWAFGELAAGAAIRREVLATLLPALTIVDRCKLEARFLVVRGDLRTYKIHLGSSNILMSPDDRYLCIVAARDAKQDSIYLPFDDDAVLSLVLSKAFLLANDRAIKDETIVRQIKP